MRDGISEMGGLKFSIFRYLWIDGGFILQQRDEDPGS